MTPYAKARLVNWLLTVSMGFLLTLYALNLPGIDLLVFETESERTLVMGAALVPYIISAFIAFRWPVCPSCQEPTHTPSQGEAGGGLAFVPRPRMRKRECGYCGQDLTVSEAKE